MPKTIFVKFLPQTNTKPARYKAYTGEQSLILSTNGLEGLAPEKQVAEALCKKFGWEGTLIEGTYSRNGIDKESVFLFENSKYVIFFVEQGKYWKEGGCPLVDRDEAKKMHRDLAIEARQAIQEGVGKQYQIVIELFEESS